MSTSKTNCFSPNFSHIYIEKELRHHPLAQRILERFPNAVPIEIDHYKDVFNRSRQNFFVQKQSQKLILAAKKETRIYPGASVCHDFGNRNFYYTSSILNCIYHCEYCYLQGMFPSANLVLFLNIEDFFAECDRLLREHPVYLAISYDTDLLALEHLVPFTARWIEYARSRPDLKMEIRTKSVNYPAIRHLPPAGNVILAWTLSPDEVVRRYEPGTPSLAARLKAARQAIEDGWPVRLCFDPVLHLEGWPEHYRACIEQTFAALPPEKILDVSIGVFRISREYLKNMRKHRTDSDLLHYPYECRDGVCSYPEEVTQNLVEHLRHLVGQYLPPQKIYV